jgi:hypothetical protein
MNFLPVSDFGDSNRGRISIKKIANSNMAVTVVGFILGTTTTQTLLKTAPAGMVAVKAYTKMPNQIKTSLNVLLNLVKKYCN